MANTDAARAEAIFAHISGAGHQLYESGEKLAELLSELDTVGFQPRRALRPVGRSTMESLGASPSPP